MKSILEIVSESKKNSWEINVQTEISDNNFKSKVFIIDDSELDLLNDYGIYYDVNKKVKSDKSQFNELLNWFKEIHPDFKINK